MIAVQVDSTARQESQFEWTEGPKAFNNTSVVVVTRFELFFELCDVSINQL